MFIFHAPLSFQSPTGKTFVKNQKKSMVFMLHSPDGFQGREEDGQAYGKVIFSTKRRNEYNLFFPISKQSDSTGVDGPFLWLKRHSTP